MADDQQIKEQGEVQPDEKKEEKPRTSVLRWLHSSDKYMGQLVGGQMHGRGTYFHSDGSIYVGDFRGGKRHGRGKYHFHAGGHYEGAYMDDHKHGAGTMICEYT